MQNFVGFNSVQISLSIHFLHIISTMKKQLNPTQLKVLTNREGQRAHQYTSEKSNTGQYWYFNNGQYGEKTACTERLVISLSYQSNNTYCQIWIFRHYLSDSGSAYGSCMLPICELKPHEKEIADLLHELDKQAGFIKA